MKLRYKLYELTNLRTLSNEINKEFSENEYFKDFKSKIDKDGKLIIIDKTDNSVFIKGTPETGLRDETAYTTKVKWFDVETKEELETSPAVYGKPENGTYRKAIDVIKENIKDADERRRLENTIER